MIASDYPLQRQTLSSLSKRLWLAAVFLNKKVICAHTHTPPPFAHLHKYHTSSHTRDQKYMQIIHGSKEDPKRPSGK